VATLIVLFASVGLLLAALGIVPVLSFLVLQQTQSRVRRIFHADSGIRGSMDGDRRGVGARYSMAFM
jgi:hypothetical protein